MFLGITVYGPVQDTAKMITKQANISNFIGDVSLVSDNGIINGRLVRLQELNRYLKDNKPPILIKKMRRIRDITNAHEELRYLDKSTSDEETKNIVLDLDFESSYYTVLRQIREVGMNKYGYKYLLATLVSVDLLTFENDFINLDLEKFKHGGVNITGFQILDNDLKIVKTFKRGWKDLPSNLWYGAGSERLQVDAALASDAVNVIVNAINQMLTNNTSILKTTFRRGDVYNYNRTRGIPCSENVPWMHGQELIKQIKQLGQWAPWKGFNVSGDIGDVVEKIPTTKKIIVTIFFQHKGIASMQTICISVIVRIRFCADLIKLVAAKCGFDYTIVPNKNSIYGTKISNNTWNGMIGELLEGNASIAVAPLTITKDREEVVDFSKPFMMSGVSIIIKKPDKQKPGVFSFMKPFSLTLWLCIVIGYVVVSFGMFLVSRFSPAEWKKVKIDDATEFSNKFSLASSLWFAMGSLMLQGSDTCPRQQCNRQFSMSECDYFIFVKKDNTKVQKTESAAGRIIGGTWWFAVLIVISSYTANLAAFLTIEKMVTAIESADDLAKQTEISYGTLDSGSTQDFFKHSNVPTYQTMWNFMSTSHPSVFAKSVEEGVARVRSSKGKYAFLLESVDEISIAVLQLIEDGSLIKLKKTWWVDKGECGVPGAHGGSKKKSLSLSNVAGVFFILIGGLVLAIIVGVSDFLRSKSRSKLGGFALIGTSSAIPIMADQSDHSFGNGQKRENDLSKVKNITSLTSTMK
ncbi:hypothetical protein KUTeg_004626 [Tegillarca granosa]|uniref:Uncharacterized protein n=1 Tax=Tegillarca granosa TaxID=220873 RepID=A0ABQ9FMF6_TEGGR|nr:hypothetical protein KUTeg_004626 [Tegillarca granosa]